MIDRGRMDIFPALWVEDEQRYRVSAMQSYTYHAGPRQDEVEIEVSVQGHAAVHEWLLKNIKAPRVFIIAGGIFWVEPSGLLISNLTAVGKKKLSKALTSGQISNAST